MSARLIVLVLVASAGGVARGQAPAPVLLNHVVLVLDSATYHDISTSPFLRDEFSGFEQLTIAANAGRTWSGSYLFGESTYLELFQPNGGAGPAGSTMIGFGVETEGAVAHLMEPLARSTGLAVDTTRRTRTKEGREVPWFLAAMVRDPDSTNRFRSWVMEYDRRYLKLWDSVTARTRDQDLLTQSAHLVGMYRPSRYFADIVGVTLAFEPALADRFIRQASVFGYRLKADGPRRILIGPGVELVLMPVQQGRTGVLEVRLALRRPKEGEKVYRFGERSVLTFQKGKLARWRF